MNLGFRSWARPRHKVFVGAGQTIDTTNGNTFRHGLGHVPGNIVVRFVCITANNGFVVGEEIPASSVYRVAGANSDGRPSCVWKADLQTVKVYVASGSIDFQTIAFSTVNFVPAQWKVSVRCSDIERAL